MPSLVQFRPAPSASRLARPASSPSWGVSTWGGRAAAYRLDVETLVLAIEGGEGGAPDDWTFVSGGRWHIGNGYYFKLDTAVGLMSKSTDWESQVGIMLETR